MIEKCPLCGKTQVFVVFVLPAYHIYSCKACLVRFVHPFVDNKQVYRSNFIVNKLQYLDAVTMNNTASDALHPYLEVTGKKILDIGCGTGAFLAGLKQYNEVLGIELSEAYRPYLEKKQIPHVIGDLSTSLANLPDKYFDLITLWDVFEHLSEPNTLLRLIKDKLSPSGHIVVWTNNYDDSLSCFAEIVYRVSLGKLSRLIAISFNKAGGHNYNFVSKSLEELYLKNSLEIVKSVITDTPSRKLAKNFVFKIALELFYSVNKLRGKGKIICHVLRNVNTWAAPGMRDNAR